MTDAPTDDGPSQPASSEPPTSPLPPPFPPLPASYEFPVQLLEQWVALPDNKRIVAPLTRQDIDNLIFGLLRGGEALTALEQTLVHWSNGRVDEANSSVAESRRLNIESKNFIRLFFTGLMISVLRPEEDGGE